LQANAVIAQDRRNELSTVASIAASDFMTHNVGVHPSAKAEGWRTSGAMTG
jgi:hypothetical protein